MNKRKVIISSVGLCLFIALGSAAIEFSFAQAQGVAARKIDEYQVQTLRSEDEQMRIWSAFDDLKKEREDAGLVIIAYGPLPGNGRRHSNRVKSYLENAHGLIPARITAVDGGYAPETSVEIWIVPSGAPIPIPSARGSFQAEPGVAQKYDEFSLDGWWFDGRYERQSERLDGFGDSLKAEPGSKGLIIVHRGTLSCETCLRPGTEFQFARREKIYLMRKHGIVPARISIARGGKVGGGRMELWVVPPGVTVPRRARLNR